MTSPDSLRIGGEFELSPGDFEGGGREEKALPTLGRPHELWLDTGRSALYLIARQLVAAGCKRIWLPAFSCESVAQGFVQAGLAPRYYAFSELPSPADGEALLFIHYFGHRNERMAAHAATLEGVSVIEDAVQAGLTALPASGAHFTVTSLRKLLPQPDGALLASASPLDDTDVAESSEAFVSMRTLAKVLRGEHRGDFLSLVETSEALLDGHIVPRRMSWLSRRLLQQADLDRIAKQRRQNWLDLVATLPPQLTPLFPELADGEIPLGLPVRVAAGRNELRRFLASQRVWCPVHWPLPHVPHTADLAADHALSEAILTLPIDQRMGSAHLDRLTTLLHTYFETKP